MMGGMRDLLLLELQQGETEGQNITLIFSTSLMLNQVPHFMNMERLMSEVHGRMSERDRGTYLEEDVSIIIHVGGG